MKTPTKPRAAPKKKGSAISKPTLRANGKKKQQQKKKKAKKTSIKTKSEKLKDANDEWNEFDNDQNDEDNIDDDDDDDADDDVESLPPNWPISSKRPSNGLTLSDPFLDVAEGKNDDDDDDDGDNCGEMQKNESVSDQEGKRLRPGPVLQLCSGADIQLSKSATARPNLEKGKGRFLIVLPGLLCPRPVQKGGDDAASSKSTPKSGRESDLSGGESETDSKASDPSNSNKKKKNQDQSRLLLDDDDEDDDGSETQDVSTNAIPTTPSSSSAAATAAPLSIGKIEKLGTDSPLLKVPFGNGRVLTFQGRNIPTTSKFMTLTCKASKGTISCKDIFSSIIVFGDAAWKHSDIPNSIPTTDNTSSFSNGNNLFHYGGSARAVDGGKQTSKWKKLEKERQKLSSASRKRKSESISMKPRDDDDDDDNDSEDDAFVGTFKTPDRDSETKLPSRRTPTRSARNSDVKYAEASDEEDEYDDNNEDDSYDKEQKSSKKDDDSEADESNNSVVDDGDAPAKIKPTRRGRNIDDNDASVKSKPMRRKRRGRSIDDDDDSADFNAKDDEKQNAADSVQTSTKRTKLKRGGMTKLPDDEKTSANNTKEQSKDASSSNIENDHDEDFDGIDQEEENDRKSSDNDEICDSLSSTSKRDGRNHRKTTRKGSMDSSESNDAEEANERNQADETEKSEMAQKKNVGENNRNVKGMKSSALTQSKIDDEGDDGGGPSKAKTKKVATKVVKEAATATKKKDPVETNDKGSNQEPKSKMKPPLASGKEKKLVEKSSSTPNIKLRAEVGGKGSTPASVIASRKSKKLSPLGRRKSTSPKAAHKKSGVLDDWAEADDEFKFL